MLKRSIVFVIFIFLFAPLSGQKSAKNKDFEDVQFRTNEIICYPSGEVRKGVVILPSQKNRSKGNTADANFVITYVNFPEAHKSATNYTLDILSSMIQSDVPIYITATYQEFDNGSNALAAANFETVFANFRNTPFRDTWFPVALAEKLAGVEITGQDRDDIFINVNSSINWYTNPNNPDGINANQFDLASVLMHEVIHGLGFSGFSTVNDDNGFYTAGASDGSRYPAIYDRFTQDRDGVKGVDQFADGSPEYKDFIESGPVFYDLLSQGVNATLHTPPTWNAGSSLYHLDENTHNNGGDNLMTPGIDRGIITHDPGIAMKMLYDMGWAYTYLEHIPTRFLEDFNTNYDLEVDVTSDTGFDTTSLELVYSLDTFKTETIVPLTLDVVSGMFEGTIPAPGSEIEFQYYIRVEDARTVGISNPASFGSDAWFTMKYGLDSTIPVIEHTEVTELTTLDRILSVTATGTDDFTGIDSMFLNVELNGSLSRVGMTKVMGGFGDFFEINFDFMRNLEVTDVLKYRIEAIDKSSNKNIGFYPEMGFLDVSIRQVSDAVDFYSSDFDEDNEADFIGNGFHIEQPALLSDPVMSNIVHPYPQAGNGNTISFIYQLGVPIIVNAENDFIQFEEIVLVEPGKNNSAPGTTDFYDYVVVEVKNINETSWRSLGDPYDCREQSIWESHYFSAGAGNISTASPRENLFVRKEYDLTEDGGFADNDTIQIRFRLFSDPGAAGWGWAIDNLNIQDVNSTVAVEDFIEENQFLVYPNPSNTGMITVAASFTQAATNLRTELTDIHGRLIRSERVNNGSQFYEQEIDISNLPAGIYFMTLRDSESAITKKVVKY